MAIDTKSLTQIITEFRALQSKDAVSPESLGYILQRIVDLLATGAVASSSGIFIQQATTERAGAMRAQQVTDLNAARKRCGRLAEAARHARICPCRNSESSFPLRTDFCRCHRLASQKPFH